MFGQEMWSEAEDNTVRTYYAKFGPSWSGWHEVLPNRSDKAIRVRAGRLGVAPKKKPSKRPSRQPNVDDRRYKVNRQRDPNESYVMSCMAKGMTPSEIDQANHWPPNTAKRILAGRWEREKRIAESYDANRKGKKGR